MAQTSLKMRMLEVFRFRMLSFVVIISVLFLFLLIQLINIQLFHGKEYELKSKSNMESNIPIPAPRGILYDRNFSQGGDNVAIVSNRPSFNITTIPAKFKDKKEFDKILNRISRLLKIPYDEIMANMKSRNPWERVVIKEDVGFDVIVLLASHPDKFPFIDWEDEPVRVYNFNNMFFHTVGYVGSISSDEYKTLRNKGYMYYHKIGKSGIEKEYDTLLRGSDGFIRRIVDVRNRVEGEEIGSPAIAGSNLVLTIDAGIQETASEVMTDLSGAVIVIKPSSGEILAMLSKPDINPNLVISRANSDMIKDLNNDKRKPFLNRAIQSRYPPASTFKIVTAISALEEEKWNPNWTSDCWGKYTLKGYVDRDFYCYKVHGVQNMYGAIAHSCSVYFYRLGYKIGPSIMLKYASYLGLNEKTGIDLPGEIGGFIPSQQWKLSTFGEPWYDGDTVNLSIGQGFLTVTPIGMANLLSGIVNGGIVFRPHLIKEVRSPDNSSIIKKVMPEKIREIPFSSLTLNTIKEGMRQAVKKGTAARLSYLKIPIAGKTGTAQTRAKSRDDTSQHAWFIGYAPCDEGTNDTVALVVFVEHGIAGAASAVPVAEKIFAKMIKLGYFNVQ